MSEKRDFPSWQAKAAATRAYVAQLTPNPDGSVELDFGPILAAAYAIDWSPDPHG